ncbi:MAG: M42 family peptidase [Clostridiaceae bacterium]|nr:M42 family peptidase [Clostridiaceae bacterium]
MMKELLRELCTLDGVSGYEDEVRKYIEQQVKPYADEMTVDSIGNLIVFKKGEKRRARPMIVCAHMDEVGFLVERITDEGMLRLEAAGGIDPRVLIGRKMRVGEKKIPGVISLKAIHLTTAEERKVAPPLDKLYIDIGAQSREEASRLVQVGDPAMFASEFYELGDDCVKAKAIDDRVGCAVMIELLKTDLPFDTYFVFATNEEIGSRGAQVAAQRLRPGCVLALEGTTAADMPDVPEHKRSTCQRKGAAVSILDRTTVYDRPFREKVLKAADEEGIRWQYRASANGGTDARVAAAAAEGGIAFGIASPTRYIHCACNVVYLPDVDEVLKLAALVIKEAGELNV